MNELRTKDIILVIFLLMGKIVGRTKMQKVIYLLQREQKIPVGLSFETYLYGPFSRELNNQVDALISDDLINDDAIITHSGDKCYKYELSKKGKKVAMQILNNLSNEKREKMVQHASKFNSMTPTEIVKYVYTTYPDAKPKNND